MLEDSKWCLSSEKTSIREDDRKWNFTGVEAQLQHLKTILFYKVYSFILIFLNPKFTFLFLF